MIATKLFNKVVDYMAVLAAILIVLTTAVVAYTIFIRFFGGIGIRWSWQFAEHSMFWFPFLAAPWLLRNHKHVAVDLVLNALPEKAKKILYIVHGILGILLCLTLAYFCAMVTWNNYTRGIMEIQVVNLPKYLLLIVLPIAFLVLTLQFVQNLIVSIKNFNKPSVAKTPTAD